MRLEEKDYEIYELICCEEERQVRGLELIASENYVSESVLEATGSILTNKYAEGYPNKRYYGGCEFIDKIEQLAIDRCCKLFNCKYANVQPHSGSQANAAAYKALLPDGGIIMSLGLDEGGHLTHGSGVSFSSDQYDFRFYHLDETGHIDYDALEEQALKILPDVILCGFSAYPYYIDFKRFREIVDKVKLTKKRLIEAYDNGFKEQTGTYEEYYELIKETFKLSDYELLEYIDGENCSHDYDPYIQYTTDTCCLMVDMAHIAGLVAADEYNNQNPCDYADVVTSTTQKTLRGPRGGIILTNDDYLIKKINSAVFPYYQGGPLEHVICAKAVCFKEALQPEFKKYIKKVKENTKSLVKELKELGYVVSDTDTHLLLLNTKESLGITGKEAQERLERVGITTNKNMLPNDTEKPNKTSGLRIGLAALTTRGLRKRNIHDIALFIDKGLKLNKESVYAIDELKEQVEQFSTHVLKNIPNIF